MTKETDQYKQARNFISKQDPEIMNQAQTVPVFEIIQWLVDYADQQTSELRKELEIQRLTLIAAGTHQPDFPTTTSTGNVPCPAVKSLTDEKITERAEQLFKANEQSSKTEFSGSWNLGLASGILIGIKEGLELTKHK